ncbi:flavodoxin family protein [Paenibacillus durus]|uniref:flavodoxin family protein n=1 Tax=Paenibacillus durus TaxID=44251 RepID=UPI0004708B17|nr:flavodoxin family protein [Paenibacillus durus]
MKVLAINASHRGEKGFTQFLINQIRSGVIGAGSEFETIVLNKYKINQCLGCELCHTGKSYLKCIYEAKDDMKVILEKMSKSDIIIYATPIHVFNMSGLMKNFIDRFNSTGDISKVTVSKKGIFFHHINADICSKPFVLLTSCGNIENEASKSLISYFKTYSRFMDAPMVGVLVRKSSFLLKSMDEKSVPKKAIILDAFRQAGRDLATKGTISKKSKKYAELNILQIPVLIKILMKIRPLKSTLVKSGLIKLK